LLALFHQETRRVFRGTRGRKSRFEHTFGGTANYAGLSPLKGEPPLHLLFDLNTEDPAVGVTLPKARWLPLLCAVRYGACDLGYRVVSDKRVKILYLAEATAWEGFPYDGYPEQFKARPVAFEEGSYDPGSVSDALLYGGVFGYGALSPRQYARLVRHVEKKGLPEMFGWESAEAY
jgi:hypothetical protein